MKLIGSHTSPFTRKARIVLAEKKMEYEFVIDSPRNADSQVTLINPRGEIPILILDDESILFDSRVIVEHIDNVTPNNKLFPAPNRERMEVKRWEALADGVSEAAFRIVLENRRPKRAQSPEWIEKQHATITRCLAFMENLLGEKSHCMGLHFSMADIAVGTALGYLSFRFPEVTWQESHPSLARLYDKLMQRPSFIETAPVE